jgi:polysaccharide deacetylase 2 family uncharacterized protein YibQ
MRFSKNEKLIIKKFIKRLEKQNLYICDDITEPHHRQEFQISRKNIDQLFDESFSNKEK